MSELIEFLKPDFSFSDERGCLFQLVHDGWKQVNVSQTKAGVKRGGHYHKQTVEAFFVVSGEVRLTLSKGGKTEQVTVKTGDFFRFPPYVAHSFDFAADTTLVALYDKPVEQPDGGKDIFKAEE